MLEKLSHSPNYDGLFKDKRLDKRANEIAKGLFFSKTISVHRGTNSEAEQKGFYRFLHNENVTEDILIKELTNRCSNNVENRDILVLQDTSIFGLSFNKENIKQDTGLGFNGNKIGLGFLSHSSIVLDANNQSMLGFGDIQLWHRTEDKANNTTRKYKQQPITEKESNKWLKASEQVKINFAHAKSMTIIEDREGDIYEQFCSIPDAKTNLLIRNRDNRRLIDGTKLHDSLNDAALLGTYEIDVLDDIRKGKKKRTAQIEIRIIKTEILKPESLKDKTLAESVVIYAVQAKEINYYGKDKICWRILTTKPTETLEEALWVITKYKQRWYIEQFFRLLKKEGFNIEATTLESGWAIRKLLILIMGVTLRLMQLYLAYGQEDGQEIKEVFTEDEIECLKKINEHQIKVSEKTKNNYNPKSVAWATYIMARLGGWKGNNKQRRAGPIILKRGLQKFMDIFQGWQLAKKYT